MAGMMRVKEEYIASDGQTDVQKHNYTDYRVVWVCVKLHSI